MRVLGLFISLLLSSANVFALLPDADFASLEVGGASRPCCNFALSVATDAMNISRLISADDLGDHHFYRKAIRTQAPEQFGITFTCKGGFIDIAHLRDTADWTAVIAGKMDLDQDGNELIHQENSSKRTLKLNKRALAELSLADRVRVAQRIAYDIAVWHEIMTGLEVHVSTRFAKETSSAFSVEDNYSNLLGTYLGASAILSDLPFNEAMTALLSQTMAEYGSADLEGTLRAHSVVRNDWWKKKLFPNRTVVMKKEFAAYESILPAVHPQARQFGCDGELVALTVPAHLSDGSKISRFYELDFYPNKKAAGRLGLPAGTKVDSMELVNLIQTVEERFKRFLP